MGAPDKGMQAAEQPAAETLLTALKTIDAAERRKHASVLNYWLSIRGDKEFPPLHDFDPLEISDFGPSSVLLELIGGGHDAEIRHLGEVLNTDGTVERIIDAPNPSVLSSIAKKLPIVAISRDFLSFEDDFSTTGCPTRCWVTLLPLSSSGAWVDYVYAFVSVDTNREKAATAPEPNEVADVLPEDGPTEEIVAVAPEVVTDVAAGEPEAAADVVPFVGDGAGQSPEVTADAADAPEASQEPEPGESAKAPAAESGPGFAKLLDGIANLAGFYGQSVKIDSVVEAEGPASDPPIAEPPVIEPPVERREPDVVEPQAEPDVVEPQAAEPMPVELSPGPQQPVSASEGTLHSKLSQVRAKADEARMAQLRATAALHQGLSDAYDFALDAEASPEEYLRLVEEQGLKIQLRAPMAPVAKLAFDGLADATTIADLESVLAWALKQELPRGSLASRIEEAGGIDDLLNGTSRPS